MVIYFLLVERVRFMAWHWVSSSDTTEEFKRQYRSHDNDRQWTVSVHIVFYLQTHASYILYKWKNSIWFQYICIQERRAANVLHRVWYSFTAFECKNEGNRANVYITFKLCILEVIADKERILLFYVFVKHIMISFSYCTGKPIYNVDICQ